MATFVSITGPIASGKNATASLLADLLTHDARTVVIAGVDEVADMVGGAGAAPNGLWFAAHAVHGALVAQWMRSSVDVVIAVGPVYTPEEQHALFGALPASTRPLRVVIDADLDVTFARATADDTRGVSRQRKFHTTAHARFRRLLPGIPADPSFDSGQQSAAEIATAIHRALRVR